LFSGYGEGFIVMVHFSGDCEVWRLVSDDPSINVPGDFNVAPESEPNPDMLDLAKQKEGHSTKTRLKFAPHAFLRTPNAVDCDFWLSYPTLMIAGAFTLTLWDIRNGIIIETINFASKTWSPTLGSRTLPGSSPMLSESEVGCLGLNPMYALIKSYSGTLQVFRRQHETARDKNAPTWDAGECVFETCAETCGRWVFEVGNILPGEFSEHGLKEYLTLLDERGKIFEPLPGEMMKTPWKRSDKVLVRHETVLSNVHVPSTSRMNEFSDGEYYIKQPSSCIVANVIIRLFLVLWTTHSWGRWRSEIGYRSVL
jgi:hypothetical protein